MYIGGYTVHPKLFIATRITRTHSLCSSHCENRYLMIVKKNPFHIKAREFNVNIKPADYTVKYV